jgi:hypothetical protein
MGPVRLVRKIRTGGRLDKGINLNFVADGKKCFSCHGKRMRVFASLLIQVEVTN